MPYRIMVIFALDVAMASTLPEWREEEGQAFVHRGSLDRKHVFIPDTGTEIVTMSLVIIIWSCKFSLQWLALAQRCLGPVLASKCHGVQRSALPFSPLLADDIVASPLFTNRNVVFTITGRAKLHNINNNYYLNIWYAFTICLGLNWLLM